MDLDLGKTEESSAKDELKEEFKEGIQTAKAEATDKVVGGVKKVEEFFDDDDESDSPWMRSDNHTEKTSAPAGSICFFCSCLFYLFA